MNFQTIARNPVAAHKAMMSAYQNVAKPETIAGNPVEIIVRRAENDRTLQQLKFYWGPCLKEISEQARIGGQKYAAEAWHELFKRQFLGYEIKKVTVAGSKRKRVIRRLRSTTGLKVRGMSKYLDQVQAFAASDLGVMFSVKDWAQWGGERIDPDTGEVLNG